MLRGRLARLTLAALIAAGPLFAQTEPVVEPSPLLTIKRERLFTDTLYGKAVLLRLDEAARLLQAENRRIDADLEAEEKALTGRRESLPAAEFRGLAEAFDAKVESIRTAQDAKGKTLAQLREAERQKVLEVAIPILAELMAEKQAVAILDKEAVFLAFDRNDVTDEAIRRLDDVLGDGSDPAAPILPVTP